MTETPAAEAPTKNRGGSYLPVLPTGWFYEVALRGPAGKSVEVEPHPSQRYQDDTPTEHNVTVHPSVEIRERRVIKGGALADAVKVGVKAARTLQELSDQEQKVAETRRTLLSTLGSDSLIDVEAVATLEESADPKADDE